MLNRFAWDKRLNGVNAMSGKIKKFVKILGEKAQALDITCDECGGKMKPGGHYQMDHDDKSYQFCSEDCMNAYEAKV